MDVTLVQLDRYPERCPLCDERQYLDWCVPFYEEPRPDCEIGDILPWGDVVGGMSCCKKCHDRIYAPSPHEE